MRRFLRFSRATSLLALFSLIALVVVFASRMWAQMPRDGAAKAQQIPAQTPQDNTAKARAIVDLLVKKEFAAVGAYFDANLQKQLTADALAQVFSGLEPQAGEFKNQLDSKSFTVQNTDVVVVKVEFEKAKLNFQMSFDKAGQVASFFVSPARDSAPTSARESDSAPASAPNLAVYQTPAYVRPAAISEREVTVGQGTPWALPATLTMPVNAGAVPAVVLVHGSGPGDRDATHTNPANKPFKDLALGLASRGIAVLRYEKRTRQYPAPMVADVHLTVKQESVDDALAAVQLLRQTAGVDAGQIYVLGHSLGGYLVPRIGARDPNIAGLIVLAGATRPLEDIIVEQYKFLAMLDGTIFEDEREEIDGIELTAARVKALSATEPNVADSYFGAPAGYFLDLKGYNPPQAAKSLAQPLLILQGERDFQVTMTDFRNWQNALQNRESVSFRSYPDLNHLFMPGQGAPSPIDYQQAGHVDPQVIADIAAWIAKADGSAALGAKR